MVSLLDREIEVFNSVYARTGKKYWLNKVADLKNTKHKLL